MYGLNSQKDKDIPIRLGYSGKGTESLKIQKKTDTTNAAVQIQKFDLVTDGTPADNLGMYHSWYIENDANAQIEVARMEVIATDVSAATEDAKFVFKTIQAGVLTSVLTISTTAATGSGGDMTFASTGTISFIDNNASSLIFQEGSNAYLTFDTTDSAERVLVSKQLEVPDSIKIVFGTGDDITMAWDGTDFDILQAGTNSSIKIGVDGAGMDLVFYGDTASVNMTWDQSADSLILNDNAKAVFGTGSDVTIAWDGTDLDILCAADNSVITVGATGNSFDLSIFGASAAVLTWDASADTLTAMDNAKIAFGDADDVTIAWDATDLDILCAANNSIIKLGNGTNSFDLWLYGSAAGNYISWDASANDLKFEDSCSLMLGTGAGAGPGTAGDVEVRWDGTDLDFLAAANNLVIKFGNGTNSFDMWWYGATSADTIVFDASAKTLAFDGVDIYLKDADVLAFGDAQDITITWDATDLIIDGAAADTVIKIGATNNQDIIVYGDTATDLITFDTSAELVHFDGFDLQMKDSDILLFGDAAGGDVQMRWDGTDFDILPAADDSIAKFGNGTLNFDVWVYGNTAADYLLWDASASTLSLTGAAAYKTQATAKTTDYTVLVSDFGKVLTTRGAGGAVIFTLPAASGNSGGRVTFVSAADQNMTVASADEETLTFNDLTADSVAASTAGQKIGAVLEAICDGTSWIVYGAAVGHTYTVASA